MSVVPRHYSSFVALAGDEETALATLNSHVRVRYALEDASNDARALATDRPAVIFHLVPVAYYKPSAEDSSR